jgi:hypothetical protein
MVMLCRIGLHENVNDHENVYDHVSVDAYESACALYDPMIIHHGSLSQMEFLEDLDFVIVFSSFENENLICFY